MDTMKEFPMYWHALDQCLNTQRIAPLRCKLVSLFLHLLQRDSSLEDHKLIIIHTLLTPYYHTYGNQSACDITEFYSVNMDV